MSPGGGGHPGWVDYPYDMTNTRQEPRRIAATADASSLLEGYG
jgi:hypothetical protein